MKLEYCDACGYTHFVIPNQTNNKRECEYSTVCRSKAVLLCWDRRAPGTCMQRAQAESCKRVYVYVSSSLSTFVVSFDPVIHSPHVLLPNVRGSLDAERIECSVPVGDCAALTVAIKRNEVHAARYGNHSYAHPVDAPSYRHVKIPQSVNVARSHAYQQDHRCVASPEEQSSKICVHSGAQPVVSSEPLRRPQPTTRTIIALQVLLTLLTTALRRTPRFQLLSNR